MEALISGGGIIYCCFTFLDVLGELSSETVFTFFLNEFLGVTNFEFQYPFSSRDFLV
jgi:hypothetical protein